MGTIVAIHIAPDQGAPVRRVDRVRAVAGRGLEGDRYFADSGTFSDRDGSDLTLVEQSALDGLADEASLDIAPGDHRRNVTTRGVRLGTLVGERFRVGDAVCVGTGPCEPCAYLETHLGEPGLRAALDGNGGLRATVVESGILQTDDEIHSYPTNENQSEY